MADRDEIEEAVRHHYAEAARAVSTAPGAHTGDGCDSQGGIGATCYDASDLDELPASAVAASIWCANRPWPWPSWAKARWCSTWDREEGSTCCCRRGGWARPAGPTGSIPPTRCSTSHGRDQARAGVDNVEFLKGHMESIPLPAASVDVVSSNCVIVLSVDKAAVFSEAHRVLRPGGRLAVADVVTQHSAGPPVQADAATWVDCASGALTEAEYRTALAAAGFVEVSISHGHAVEGGLTSVTVRASRN